MIGRLAAVDYGRKRIGLAVCDALGITVTGLPTVVRNGTEDAAVAAVANALLDRDVTRLVVGLPLHADGRESEMSLEARAFGTRVGATMRKDVVYFDETLTSWDAEETLKARGKNLRDARLRGDVDRAAAVSILRSYLQALEAAARPPLPDFDPDSDPDDDDDDPD